MMKLFVIGLDGATWTVMDPLLKAGRLPHLARLIAGGARMVSTTIEPALSPIIWTSLATGKRPNKHGVTHFFDTANHLRCKRLWDLLEQPDRPIGVFGWPVTWPPRPAYGFIVPSLFERANDTFPPELRFVKDMEAGLGKTWKERAQLIGEARRHGLRLSSLAQFAAYLLRDRVRPIDKLERYARQRFLKLALHLDVYEYLVKRYRPYFTSFYVNQPDAFSHRYWRYYEPELFPDVTEAEARRYGDMIPRIYEACDRAVGRLMQLTDENTLVAVVSDHGFAASPTSASEKQFVGRLKGDKLFKLLELNGKASYVNHRDWIIIKLNRQVNGERAQILDRLREIRVRELNAPLLDVTEDETGEIIVKIKNRTHLYKSDVDLNTLHLDYRDYSGAFLDMAKPDYDTRVSGEHHPNGVSIFYGPGVRRGAVVRQSSVLDVTPTLLALLGMPLGRDMDGRVLTEAITPDFLAENPIEYVNSYDSDVKTNEVIDDEPVSEELMTRLRDLGYVE